MQQSRLGWLLLSILLCFNSFAQVQSPRYNVSMGPNTNGFYEYLPQGYDPNSTQLYPLILFIHGLGDTGNGSAGELPRLLQAGLCKLINDGNFPSSFTVGGQTHRFIVLSPQFSVWPGASDIDAILNYAVGNYKVNINRVYITGMSMGGGVTWEYAGWNSTNANRVAAIVPIAGATYPDYGRARTIANTNLPVWATHNDGDTIVSPNTTNQYVAYVNDAPAPNPNAKKTIFTSNSHDAWTQTYNPGFTENGLNIYQWMLQYQRPIIPLPVQIGNYKAAQAGFRSVKVSWTTTDETNNSHFTLEHSTDRMNFTSIATIPGRNTASAYQFTHAQATEGENFYRLSQTDLNGRKTTYEILRVELKKTASKAFVAPNPASHTVEIIINDQEADVIQAGLYDISGSLIKEWQFTKATGIHRERVSLAQLISGNYVIRLNGKKLSESILFTRQ